MNGYGGRTSLLTLLISGPFWNVRCGSVLSSQVAVKYHETRVCIIIISNVVSMISNFCCGFTFTHHKQSGCAVEAAGGSAAAEEARGSSSARPSRQAKAVASKTIRSINRCGEELCYPMLCVCCFKMTMSKVNKLLLIFCVIISSGKYEGGGHDPQTGYSSTEYEQDNEVVPSLSILIGFQFLIT